MKSLRYTTFIVLILLGTQSVSTAGVRADTLSERSIYRFDASWTDQDGRDLRLADLGGTPLLAAMIYTDCKAACPMIVHEMKKIGANLERRGITDFGYLLISLDPENDLPEMLRKFSQIHGLHAPLWTLLNGRERDVRTLATLLGVRYKRETNGQYSHANVIILLDAGGEIVHRQDRLDADAAETAEAIRARLTYR